MTIEALEEILRQDKPSEEIRKNEKEIFDMIPELEKCKGCEQNSPWHVYDVYEHILHTIDNIEKDDILRMSALFHDLGKPETKETDKYGLDHFPNHWYVSKEIFDDFSKEYGYDEKKSITISKLIKYHDLNLWKVEINNIPNFMDEMSKSDLILLYKLKKADLLAQNSEYHYLLEEYDKQENIYKLLYERVENNE